MPYTYERIKDLFEEMLNYICECSPSEADAYITLTGGIGFTDEELKYEGFDVNEMKREAER